MSSIIPLMVEIGMLLHSGGAGNLEDVAHLNEMLRDRQHPRTQSQAALLLVQSHSPEAAALVRQGLQATESPEVFQALAAALRMQRDTRFLDELFTALTGARAAVRQESAETIASLADEKIILRLQALTENAKVDLEVRQAVVWALGRSGRKAAVVVLLDLLSSPHKVMRESAAEALRDLTGQGHGTDAALWRVWWNGHKDVSNEGWLEARLAYQAARSRRLKGAGALVHKSSNCTSSFTVVCPRPTLGHVQAARRTRGPNRRALAVTWCTELLST